MLTAYRMVMPAITALALIACMAEEPDTDLVEISKTLAEESKAPVNSVGRDPGSVSLSDRAYTYVDLDPKLLNGKKPPYYLDLDIPFDTAVIWTQADIDCDGCDEKTKKERAQKWDLKIHGRDISLNTSNLDKTGSTLQGMASTDIRATLQNFEQSIDLRKYKILPQASEIQPKVEVKNFVDGNAASTFGNAALFRTTKGDRIIYLELVVADTAADWVLFHVREQILGKDKAFKSARRLYLKWGQDAIGTGIMDVDDFGVLRAYFDFDACFKAENEPLCFAGNGDSALNSNIVASQPMPNWDLYVELNTLTWSNGSFSLNGGVSRDAKRNNEFDAAALYLGQIKGQGQSTYTQSMKQLWGFASMQEFWFAAPDQPERYAQTSLGTDGKNAFYSNVWYQIEQRQNTDQTDKPIQIKAIPNRRIYILETTQNEGLLFQVTGVDKLGGITQIAYKGGKVKQPRQFKIKFRQSGNTLIKRQVDTSAVAVPIFALDAEIVDADSGQRLSEDEFKQVKVFIRRFQTDTSSTNQELETTEPATLNKQQAAAMTREITINTVKQTLSTKAGDYQAVYAKKIIDSCTFAARKILKYEVWARLPGEPLQIWPVSLDICRS